MPGRRPRQQTGSSATPVPGAAAGALAMADQGAHPETTGTHPTSEPHADVVPFPAVPGPQSASSSSSGERRADEARPPRRPPVLASESLREDMEPTEPWRRTVRIGGTALALVGAIATLALGGLDLTVLTLGLLLLGAGALCAAPTRYAVRAFGLLSIAGVGLVVATAARLSAGAPLDAPILALGTVMLAGGLLFRSAYRASQLARTMVAVGMLAIAVALLLADAMGEFTQIGPSWQTWLHAVTATGFGILLLLSLLTFMAPSTTGGTQVWGVALLFWYALHAAFTLVTSVHPADEGEAAIAFTSPTAGVTVAAAACAVLSALALAQTLAVLAGGTAEQRKTETDPGPA
ncbi:MAG: hypothetical protein ACOCV4_08195 [Myxococcota bacterium]